MGQPVEYLTPNQAAAILHLSPRTLEGMRYHGKGPRFAKLGTGRSSRILYPRDQLDGWVTSLIRQSTKDEREPESSPAEFLRAQLSSGPKLTVLVEAAARRVGYTHWMVREARKLIGVRCGRSGLRWVLWLPSD